MTRLVDPSAFAAVFLFRVVGWFEVAVFIKILFGIVLMLAHVHLELSSSPAALPAMVGVPKSEDAVFNYIGQARTTPHELVPQITCTQAQQVHQKKEHKDVEQPVRSLNSGEDDNHPFHRYLEWKREEIDGGSTIEEVEHHQQRIARRSRAQSGAGSDISGQ